MVPSTYPPPAVRGYMALKRTAVESEEGQRVWGQVRQYRLPNEGGSLLMVETVGGGV